MKERPILFSGEMVRAILGGRKTQTRRAVHRRRYDVANWDLPDGPSAVEAGYPFVECQDGDYISAVKLCPYGQPGDRLWVRETWRYDDWTEDGEPFIRFSSDDKTKICTEIPEDWWDRVGDTWASLSLSENVKTYGRARDPKWRSPRFMPRWASRITLEIVNVRVERVQEITPVDAIAEGIFPTANIHSIDCETEDPRTEFRELWDSINAKRGYGWDSNPWVWVIEFRRVAQ